MVLIKAAAVVAVIASANAFLQPAPMAVKSGEKLVIVFPFEHRSCSDAPAFVIACCRFIDADEPRALCSAGVGEQLCQD
jgi:hypothetical protein